MNFQLSICFRAIPLLMAAICLPLALFIINSGETANYFVSGHVVIINLL